jgi:hypothetical protein
LRGERVRLGQIPEVLPVVRQLDVCVNQRGGLGQELCGFDAKAVLRLFRTELGDDLLSGLDLAYVHGYAHVAGLGLASAPFLVLCCEYMEQKLLRHLQRVACDQ